jgi:hypothetical protein
LDRRDAGLDLGQLGVQDAEDLIDDFDLGGETPGVGGHAREV